MPNVETKKATVLIIDDELGPRESIRMVLANEFNCLVAMDGEKGIQSVKENQVDIVILDIRMPGIDGIETLRRIREINNSVVVILLTGYGTLESAQKAIRYGAFDYLKKPFDIQELRSVVHKALERKTEIESRQAHLDELEKMVTRWEQEMPKMDRMSNLGELSSTIVHEMKNPLTVILGYTQMILNNMKKGAARDGVVLNGRSLEQLQVIEKETVRCAEIAMKLLKVTKMSGEEFTLTDLQEMVKDTEALILPQCSITQITVKKDLCEGLLNANIVKGKIHDILLNLCINAIHAIQATNKAGTITFRTTTIDHDGTGLKNLTKEEKEYLTKESASKYAAISIQDTGTGIPEKIKEKIFEHLFTTKESGTGIGLHVAKQNAVSNHGNLSLVQTGTDGTTFRLLLPLI
jgi:two-component system, sensor histidine kinase and response regulator